MWYATSVQMTTTTSTSTTGTTLRLRRRRRVSLLVSETYVTLTDIAAISRPTIIIIITITTHSFQLYEIIISEVHVGSINVIMSCHYLASDSFLFRWGREDRRRLTTMMMVMMIIMLILLHSPVSNASLVGLVVAIVVIEIYPKENFLYVNVIRNKDNGEILLAKYG